MGKFKVGDRVKTNGGYSFDPGIGTVVKAGDGDDLYFVDVDGEEGPGCDPGWAYSGRDLVAVAPATATLTIEAGKFYKTRDGRKVGPMEEWREGAFREADGDGRFWHRDGEGQVKANGEDIVAEWVDEPVAPAEPIATTLGIDLNPALPPRVGDDVLIFGTIAAINQSPSGTNYNIVFETQNRRMSLHFLEEDFIVVDDDDGGCTCASNDNRPLPSDDRAKAFDAIGDWLRSLAVERAA